MLYPMFGGVDDDDDNDDKLFLQNGWWTLSLFSTGAIGRDSHHRRSLGPREKGLNLRRTLVQALLN